MSGAGFDLLSDVTGDGLQVPNEEASAINRHHGTVAAGVQTTPAGSHLPGRVEGTVGCLEACVLFQVGQSLPVRLGQVQPCPQGQLLERDLCCCGQTRLRTRCL